MTIPFALPSSDPALLQQATRIAEEFSQGYQRDGILGIVFLGAVARGYYDPFADIDVILYRAADSPITLPANYIHQEGLEIHCDLLDYAKELAQPWDMAKRWAFSTRRIVHDPQGLLDRLFAQKVPLQPDERRWLMIEGMAQSDWYCATLPRLWVARGNLRSAQSMFSEGITLFFNALFGLNNELVADVKWRAYCVERLAILPPHFPERIAEVLTVRAFSEEDIQRRTTAFMAMWQEMLPLVEEALQMKYAEFSALV